MNTRIKVLRCLLVAISFTFSLLLAELACRIFAAPTPCIRFQQDVSELQGLKLNEAARMIQNDPELFWRLRPNTTLPDSSWPFFGIISNGQSLREDHEIAITKPEDQLRILFLGDSCTFGYGVAQSETFVEVAESLIQETSGKPVECINAGVPGYTIFQGYRYLLTEGLLYKPDLVVLNFGWNDYGMWDDRSDADHYVMSQAMLPPRLLQDSRLCQLIWAHIGSSRTTHQDAERRPRILPVEFAETLENISSITEERHIPLLILVWPMRANTSEDTPPDARTSLQAEMISFGQAHPVSTSPNISGVLDLIPLGQILVREHGAPAIYFDNGHVTPTGHQAIGHAIADHVAPWLNNR